MNKKITIAWLKKHKACKKAIEEYQKRNKILTGEQLIRLLMREKRYAWCNWLITRFMRYKQYVSYAVYSVEQVIDIYEERYPDDDRPRKAIEAAKMCIKNPSKKNKSLAYNAAAASAKIKLKILRYGIKLLKE